VKRERPEPGAFDRRHVAAAQYVGAEVAACGPDEYGILVAGE
jgi:hypothetical protein